MTTPIGDDTEDLEALFERISAQREAAECAVPVHAQADGSGEPAAPVASAEGQAYPEQPSPVIFDRIGKLTRSLHDALRELGYDKAVEKAVVALPDARDRLSYIATLTGQAAERTLGALEEAKPIQERMEQEAASLARTWDRLLAGALPYQDFKPLVLSTREFLHAVPQHTERTNCQLLEIMMAQDFHDLTGQVIKKVVELAHSMEQQLLQLLLETSPRDQQQCPDYHLSGPVVSADGRSDVVTNQAQVDDLLESLGF